MLCLFLHPTHVIENAQSWSLEFNLVLLPELFGAHFQPTLIFSLYRPCTTHITSLINPLLSGSQEYFKAISDLFRVYYTLIPNYNAADPNCTSKAVLATN